MELCQMSLEDFVKEESSSEHAGLHPVDVVALGLSLVDALESIHHRARICHLDIKPANILIAKRSPEETQDAPRRVKLTDFGIAHQLPTCVETETKTEEFYARTFLPAFSVTCDWSRIYTS